MGSDEEKPSHRVYLDAFYIDKYELTTSRYAQFLKATRRKQPDHWNEVSMAAHRDRPVIGVDWHDADAYCRWSGKRLPTEAEWEKAARGTEGRQYPWGNERPTSRNANFGKCCDWKGYASLAPVGSLEAGKSPLGISDMAGNVYEWVADWYGGVTTRIALIGIPKAHLRGNTRCSVAARGILLPSRTSEPRFGYGMYPQPRPARSASVAPRTFRNSPVSSEHHPESSFSRRPLEWYKYYAMILERVRAGFSCRLKRRHDDARSEA